MRDWAAAHPDDPIVYGVQASYQLVGEPLTRHLLDRVLPDRPLGVHAFDGHTVWANTMALERAGLLHGRELPPGNEIVMGADGLATGELREPAAYAPLDGAPAVGRAREVRHHHRPRPRARRPPRPRAPATAPPSAAACDWCARHGITSIHNMDGNPYQLGLLEELDDAGELCCRFRLPFHMKNDMTPGRSARPSPRRCAPAAAPTGSPATSSRSSSTACSNSTTAFMLGGL